MHLLVFISLFLYLVIPSNTNISSQEIVDKRDQKKYEYVVIGKLKWMISNLQYESEQSKCTEHQGNELCKECGQFYLVEDALNICPDGWRLPTQEEIKTIIKLDRKHKINLIDTLNIELCGRMDNGKSGKHGEQTTFWINDELKDGDITHWHIFGDDHELHSHNVVNAKRQFPVRCVCELEN